jgi:coenzyme F420-reducing hydrogenase delta subunit
MAFHIEKEKTTSTPYILADEEKSYMRLEGKCFHEKVADFFKDINDWLAGYLATNFGTFTLECEFDYFNSSTTKLLHNMLMKMDNAVSDTNRITVNWITTDDNDIMVECGEDFKEDFHNLEFNLILKP